MNTIPLSKIVEDAIDSLSMRIQETGASVQVGPMPEVDCDAILLEQVFQNFIANALLYTKNGESPSVFVESQIKDGEVEISVRDGGIGIDDEGLKLIFAPFKRLHARHEYSGTGIGLSICKKVVERHGGVVGVRSTIGVGSTFYFTLPLTRKETVDA